MMVDCFVSIMEGRLKQKMQGMDGILYWRQRHFALDPRTRCLTITDDTDGIDDSAGVISNNTANITPYGEPDVGTTLSVTRMSLEGARRAVAWSGIDAFNGCGFNVIWASGRVWSFLCDDPHSRKSWVDALNQSIGDEERDTGGEPSCQRSLFKGSVKRTCGVCDRHQLQSNRVGDAGDPRSLRKDLTPPLPPRGEEAEVISKRTQRRFFPLDSRTATKVRAQGSAPPEFDDFGRSIGEDRSYSYEEGRVGGKRLTMSELSSSGKWAYKGQAPGHMIDESLRYTQRHRRQCRFRRHDSETEDDGEGSVCSAETCAALNGRPSAPRYRGGQRWVTCSSNTTGTGEVSKADGTVDAGLARVVCCGGGGGKSRAHERSEQLARASAVTWGRFQRLLEKSRELKLHFDGATDGSTGREVGSGEGRKMVEDERDNSAGSFQSGHGSREGGVGAAEQRREFRAPSPPTVVDSMAPTTTVTASLNLRRFGDSFSAGVSSTGHLPLATSASGVDECEGSNADPNGLRVKVAAVRKASGMPPNGRANPNVNVDPAEQSRLSAMTDIGTSFLVPRREAEGGDHSSTDASSTGASKGEERTKVCGDGRRQIDGENRRQQRRRRRRVSSTKVASQHCRKPVAAPKEAEDVVVPRLRLLEAELERARREAAVAAQTEERLRHELATADSERRRLEGEVAITKSASEKERQNEIEALTIRALTEREKGRAEGEEAAKAEAQRRDKSKLTAALAATKRAESEKAAVARQKEELEKALAAEIGERRRVASLLEECSGSEKSLQKRLEATAGDGDLKARLASTRAELDAVRLERDSMAEDLNRCIGRLGNQAKKVASALRSKQLREIAEISSRHEMEKEEMREQLVREAEERVKEGTQSALAAQEMMLRAEVVEAARREAELGEEKLRAERSKADATGDATRKDIEKLRGLHAKRVRRLEALLKEETENLADARREIAVCKATLAGDAGEFQRWTEEQRDQSGRFLKELARIQKQVDSAATQEAAAREREGLAMGQLRKVMEEARLERAEGVELRRQLREALAELESNRSVQARRARSGVQLQRAAEIARNEVAMLEAERSRWNEERRSMETALDRLKRLVYGARTTTNTAPATASKGKALSHPARATSAKNASKCSWRPAGGSRSEGGWGQAYDNTRLACSTIGVNAARGCNRDAVAVGERVGKRTG